ANAVKITIGPKGRNVVIDKGYGAPMITNDGVTIAKEITLSNKVENMGAEIIKDVASKTNDTAGDGTTTAVILTQAIFEEGLKKTSLGVNAMGVKIGIEKASEEVVKALKALAKPIKDKNEIVQVATISAESEEFGQIIAEAIEKVGKDGVVTVEESQSFGVESEFVEGMQFNKGYLSPYMITDGDRMEAEYKDALVLLCDKKISSIKEILPLLEKLAGSGKKELVIIADDIDGEALATLVVNKIRGTFNTLAIKSPGYGDHKKEMLGDIAILTGGEVVSEDVGIKLENVEISMLGRARRVISSKDETTIVGGKGKKSDIDTRIASIKKQIESADSVYDKDKLRERLGKLSGGVAVIKVGATTEAEMKYKKLKIDDAVAATKAAIDEGIVSGGGVALIKAGAKVASKKLVSPSEDIAQEFQVGVKILLKALEAPIRQIVINAGKDNASVIIAKILAGKGSEGYDANADKMVTDMFKAGIIDPAKVTRTGLERASGAASMLLTTEVAICDEPKKEEAGHGGGMPGMDY
ncbi:MAG: chaperonin GroEL, partial [Candidatus Vogelbacteria bacterium]|nr:chaperonin GroEL [Candidatus Vogelbacteria bacterium]